MEKIIINTVFVVTFLLVMSSCQNCTKKAHNTISKSEVKKELSNEWSEFFNAWVEGDAIKCSSFFTTNGIHFRPAGNIDTGIVKIRESFAQILAGYKIEYCYQYTLDIELFENKILEYGTYEQKWSHSEHKMKGSYIAVWERVNEESIKLSRLIFN